jgi:aryl carrier-like protein
MVPARIVVLGALPRTPNGKVDRHALPQTAGDQTTPVDRTESATTAPHTPTELALAQIWAEILHLDRVSTGDEIFSLGADSLHIFRIVARANKQGLRLTAKVLMRHRTIAAIARYIDQAPAAVGSNGAPRPMQRDT